MALGSLFAFWLIAALLIAVPGPDWAFTIGATLRGQPVRSAVGGLVLGYAVVTAVVAAGVGALVAGSPAALTVLAVAGGGYLTWVGASTLARPAAPLAVAAVGNEKGILIRGMGVSGLNPKGLLLFVALLPQFASRHASWPFPVQLLALGAAYTLTCAVFYACLGLFVRTALRARPGTAGSISRVSGAAMVILGLALIAERVLA